MQNDKIEIAVLQDSLAPVPPPSKSVDPAPETSAQEPPKPEKAGCEDPDCPVCRWVPIIKEISENMTETDVFMNMVEGGYPVGFSFFMLPKRVDAQESLEVMELMEGLEEAVEEKKNLVIPADRVPTLFSALDGVLEENADFTTLTVINDATFKTAVEMLGWALGENAEKKKLAAVWYKNLLAQDPRSMEKG